MNHLDESTEGDSRRNPHGDIGVGDRSAGLEPGERRLNGVQTTGRNFRNLSKAQYKMLQEPDRTIAVRDGIRLYADVIRPEAEGSFPALVAVSPYPRQIQNVGAPLGFVEAGASDFWVSRGYAHVIANLRGTGGSEGTYGMFDSQERDDVYDIVEWAAAQEWCDGNVGMIGISYFAMTQLEAAVKRPPHLRAIFPFAVSVDLYEAVYHEGVLSQKFVNGWLHAVAVMANLSPEKFRSLPVHMISTLLKSKLVHEKMAQLNGEAIMGVIGTVIKGKYNPHPWDDLYYAMMLEHQIYDEFWKERSLSPLLDQIDIPTYLGCDWENVPLHLPGTFIAWEGISQNAPTRIGLLDRGGLLWPWESLHIEALAWFDHWLKGKDTGILEGPSIRYWMPGTQEWRTSEEWPPKGGQSTTFALTAKGALALEEGPAGTRSYFYIPPTLPLPKGANPPMLPSELVWETEPLPEPIEFVGYPELTLDAAISAIDTAWIVTLQDVMPDGTTQDVTAGWLRAALHEGNPPKALPAGDSIRYKIPLICNAQHFGVGHKIRLVIASADGGEHPSILGFQHTPVGIPSQNTIYSSSRLMLPVMPISK
jgi:predicted acyl esterase